MGKDQILDHGKALRWVHEDAVLSQTGHQPLEQNAADLPLTGSSTVAVDMTLGKLCSKSVSAGQ